MAQRLTAAPCGCRRTPPHLWPCVDLSFSCDFLGDLRRTGNTVLCSAPLAPARFCKNATLALSSHSEAVLLLKGGMAAPSKQQCHPRCKAGFICR